MTMEAKSTKKVQLTSYRSSFRYLFVFSILKIFLYPLMWLLFNFRSYPYIEDSQDSNYIILSNHTGALDPLMLSLSFKRPIFFVASDHLFRLGFISKIIDFLVAPIPIVKSKLDLQALRIIRSELEIGNTVALFPSGSRSISGPEEPIPSATSKLLKLLNKPVLLYRLEGGYLTSPRWARSHRRGKMSGRVVHKLTVEDIKNHSYQELNEIVYEYLNADPYAAEKPNTTIFRGRNLAQYLERIVWHCPSCLRLGTVKSEKDIVFCDCGFRLRYDPTGYFQPAGNTSDEQDFALRFPHVDSLYQWQLAELKKNFSLKNLTAMNSHQPIFSDDEEILILTSRAEKNERVLHGSIALYPDRLEFSNQDKEVEYLFPLDKIHEVHCIGPQRLQFTDERDKLVYESINENPRSAFKYIETIKQIKSQIPRN